MRLADKIATMARRGAPLPYDAEVEWIASTDLGGQFIDTGIYDLPYYDVEVGFMRTTLSHRLNAVVFGARDDNSVKDMSVFFTDLNESRIICRISELIGKTVEMDVHAAFNTRCVVNLSNNYMSYECGDEFQESHFSVGKFRTSKPITIFKLNGTTWSLLGIKFIYLVAKNGNDVIYDFIPVRVGNEGCLFERVSCQLFRNSGTGAFIVGPDVVSAGGGY